MARVSWPTTSPDEWQVLYLGGTIFPGLAIVSGLKGGQKIDVKDGPGSDGESTTQQGEKAKSGKILLRMWTKEQWEEFDDAFELIEPVIGKRTPVDVASGAMAFRNVNSILIEDVEGPDWDPDKRWMDVAITWRQHRPPPPKNATSKNDASKASQSYGQQFEHMPNRPPKGKRLIVGDEDAEILVKAARESTQQGFSRNVGQVS